MSATADQAREAAIAMLRSARDQLRLADLAKHTNTGHDSFIEAVANLAFKDLCRHTARAYVTSACMILDPGRTLYDADKFLVPVLPSGQAVADLGPDQYAAVIATWIDHERAAGR